MVGVPQSSPFLIFLGVPHPSLPTPGEGLAFLEKKHRLADVLVQIFGRAGTKAGRDGLSWVVLWWPGEGGAGYGQSKLANFLHAQVL